MESEELECLFNVVFTKVKLVEDVDDPERIDGLAIISGNMVVVPNNLINVSEFDILQQFYFAQMPNELRESLATKGIEVSLRYRKIALGTALVFVPDTFIDQIGYKMNDLFNEETVSLTRKRDGKVMGTVGVSFVLMAKCGEKSIVERRSSRRSFKKFRSSRSSLRSHHSSLLHTTEKKEECTGLGPEINPQDVLFVVGDPDPLLKIPAEHTSEEEGDEEGDKRVRLDLQRYRRFNRRVSFPPDDPCPGHKPSFSQLKELTEKYGRIIDSVTEKLRQLGVNTTDSPSEDTIAAAAIGTPQVVDTERWIPVPVESEDEFGVKPIRYCPVCLYSMSWLPRYSPCLNCNTRPRDVPKAGSGEMTANEIVAEQIRSKDLSACEPMVNTGSDAECPPCRCTCKDDKLCAHCRIRQLCAEIFESDEEARKQVVQKQEEHLERYPKPRSSEDFALISGPEDDDRPYLTRVFSEIKSLYALHDNKKMKAIQRHCRSQTLLTTRSAPSVVQSQSQHNRLNAHARESFNRQKAGHKDCLPPDSHVPRRHGWNWPQSPEAKKYGWRPGAILRAAVQVMRFFFTSEEDRNPLNQILAENEVLTQHNSPVLNICKRDGDIFVTLRPLGDNLGKNQKPITFRIVKSHLAVALRQIKRTLKDQGFEKCACHKSLMLCTCRTAPEKFELNKALRRECQRRFIKPCPEHLVLTDTSVSDLEFNLDVHPPSKSCMSRIKAIRNSVNHGTQTSKADPLPPPPQYPIKVSPYHQAFDCAAGDRYMGTAFGLPGEDVFEDGVFGLSGGGPHGPNPMPCGVIRPANAWGGGAGGGMFAGRRGRQGASGGGPGGGAWKGFPGVKDKDGKGRRGAISGPIPVRYPKRFLKPAQEAAKAAKEAERAAAEKKRRGPDMLKYLQQKGTLVRPWNPDEGKDTRPRPPKLSDKGPDGLTVFQRRRRELMAGPPPLLCQIPRRGKGYDPCAPYRMEFVC